MQKFLLASLFVLVASATVEFGKETAYAQDNYVLEFSAPSNDLIFIYVSWETVNNLDIYIRGGGGSLTTFCNKPGEGILYNSYTAGTYNFGFSNSDASKKDNGTFWMNPSTNELGVDLNKKYEGKFPIILDSGNEKDALAQLTYTINNAEKDITFKFNYNSKVEITGYETTVSSPFEVCDKNNNCVSGPETYEFQKGESYKIYVKIREVLVEERERSLPVLPPFSFSDVNYKEGSQEGTGSNENNSSNLRLNLWIISLLLFLL